MAETEYLRVVVSRRGKVRTAEFRLREGESGLSMFLNRASPAPAQIIEAVRAAGKQGDLAIAVIDTSHLAELGLRIIRTPGGTTDAEVNAIHVEARLPWWRRIVLVLRGTSHHEYFNNKISSRLAEVARLIGDEGA